jgi:hypothetical protein
MSNIEVKTKAFSCCTRRSITIEIISKSPVYLDLLRKGSPMFGRNCVVVCLALLGFCGVVSADVPATQPAGSDVDLRDYCTVLLASKVQDHLGVTNDQRSKLADMKTKLNFYLDNAAGSIHGPQVTPGLVAGRAEVALKKAGTLVRDELTPVQRSMLAAMFDDKTLKPIAVSAAVETGRSARGATVITGVHLDYTHYGEKDAASDKSVAPLGVASASPASQPTNETDKGAPAGNTSPPPISPGRQRRTVVVDVPAAIAMLQANTAGRQVSGANRLVRAVPNDKDRAAVLDALRTYVKDTNDEHWASFATPFCSWADAAELELVKSCLVTSDGLTGIDQKESVSAAACAALLRLDRKSAVDAINSRLENQMFRTHLAGNMRSLAEQSDSMKPVADRVADQLGSYRSGKKITLEP